jgi:hypothetical protein
MDNVVNTLAHRLGEHLPLSLARVKCLSELVLGLLRCESVNLRKLSLRMGGGAKCASQYRRLQRFFPEHKV